MYCYIRMSRLYLYQEAAGGIRRLLGFTIGVSNEGVGGEGADGETADIEEAAEEQAVSEREDDGQTIFEDADDVISGANTDSEDLFSS